MHWLGRHRLSILGSICFFFTALVLLLNFTRNVPFYSTVYRSEQAFEDLLRSDGRKTSTHPDFVFLGIDESTRNFQLFDPNDVPNNRAFQLMIERPYPWSREVWALLLDRLFQAGRRLSLFDLGFVGPTV